MIQRIPFELLGHQNHGWLDARHHFSFARYWDPERLGYPPLRVWNDDTIKGGTGFPLHPHQNMEIITYIRSGAITHEDNLGNRGRIEAGEIQVMSAGTGIIHSEYNHEDEDTTLFQIWIEPSIMDVKPRWVTRSFPREKDTHFHLLASGKDDDSKQEDVIPLYQNAALWAGTFPSGHRLDHPFSHKRHGYLVATRGKFTLNGDMVEPRDGVYIQEEESLSFEFSKETEIVFVDLPVLD